MKKLMMTGMMTGVLAVGLAGRAVAQEKASWTDAIKLKGDVRFRYQNTDEERKDARERWRFRGRIGLDAKVNDQVRAELRLVTTAGDPISDNITMGGIGAPFQDAITAIDRANLTWTPMDMLALKAGKMGQPWVAVADLVMSGDANPEGLAANVSFSMDPLSLNLHGGAFVLKERKADDETMLYTGQIATKVAFGKKSHVRLGGTVYAYDGMKDFEPLGENNNTTVEVGEDDDAVEVIANDFVIIEAFAEANLNVGLPVTIGAQYMVNTEADDHDTGYLGSLAVKVMDGLKVGYQYRYVEKDSTFSGLAESTDFGNGGVDLKGHIPYVSYDINKNFSVKAQYAIGQKGVDDGTDIDTFKIDVACKF